MEECTGVDEIDLALQNDALPPGAPPGASQLCGDNEFPMFRQAPGGRW